MRTRLLHAATAAGLTALAFSVTPAKADHPWQDAPTQASITTDAILPQIQPTTLLAEEDGNYLALDENGHPVRITVTGATPLNASGAPTERLAALTTSDGQLWALTSGAVPTLIRMSREGTVVSRTLLDGAAVTGSNLVALQIHGTHAYLADEGKAALIVANLQTGKASRFLAYDPSLTGRHPLLRNGQPSIGPDGHPIAGGNVRFLMLDKRGQWLFYQPACGPMYRIDTALLTDPAFTPVEQLDGITEWRTTPSLGGATLTSTDTFYLSDIEGGSLLKFGSDRIPLRILRDPRLVNAGAPALSNSHELGVLVTEDGTTHILRIALP
ncbi:NHL repeat-containing protein [Gluconobacter kanchanaburiensis]|uniref:Uncharacterized protein n=1 Tax=Gluconobacter kanchanaburiensis NBRC 103587 TaxID=1307948 RepID=A0A511B3Q9_9PROT|nr:hypothetical protein [Gluconobacter kanchanaburiensis]MBF0860747.1 hypothetical protein [Gluconobacter kanchanaburiensis]GBR69713.1 hypothetical protein AA103587_1482 [Gluconobacter kanchanaburiensis NBRC 103587]GEK95075.1 hypothetical protein GKA01_02720 [Gluconobacter kanchanaburiensis NBRC 103587]